MVDNLPQGSLIGSIDLPSGGEAAPAEDRVRARECVHTLDMLSRGSTYDPLVSGVIFLHS